MTTEQKWTARIAEWRASGLRAAEFCAGRDFAAGALRYQTKRLERLGRLSSVVSVVGPQPVRLARVDRVPSSQLPPPPSAMLTIELGRARVIVPSGFDAATVRAVLETLSLQMGGGGQ
jgi:hypothetical protein